MLTQERNGTLQLLPIHTVSSGQDDRTGCFHLIVVELTEIAHVYLHLGGIHNCYRMAQGNILPGNLLHRANHIGQLAHAGRLNQNPIRSILSKHLLQSLAKIAYQAAANTAGVHLRDLNTGLLQKAAINADLAKLIFDQHQFLASVAFLYELFD